jgi:hypothetical protein
MSMACAAQERAWQVQQWLAEYSANLPVQHPGREPKGSWPHDISKEPHMTRVLLVGATALALLSGCAHSSQPAAAAPMAGAGDDMKAMCPMGVPGT